MHCRVRYMFDFDLKIYSGQVGVYGGKVLLFLLSWHCSKIHRWHFESSLAEWNLWFAAKVKTLWEGHKIQKNLPLVLMFTHTVGFWCQTIHKKFLPRFDTIFGLKMMMKSGLEKLFWNSTSPFRVGAELTWLVSRYLWSQKSSLPIFVTYPLAWNSILQTLHFMLCL